MVIFRENPAIENFLLNPDFKIAQEWDARTSIAHTEYAVDGWQYIAVTSAVYDSSISTDVPTFAQSGLVSTRTLKMDCTTADATIAAGDIGVVQHYIEGYDAQKLYEKPIVLRFWHKHTKTGTHCVTLLNAAATRGFVREYTQSVSDTWEEAVLYFDANDTSSGVWEAGNAAGFVIRWTLFNGSTYQTTEGAWNTGNFSGTSSQVNNADSTSNNFMINSPCLYSGSVDLGYFSPSFEQQLIRCERYFEKSYDLDTDPGTATGTGANYSYILGTFYTTQDTIYYRVPKRVAGTVTIYDTNSGTAAKYSSHNAAGTHQADRAGAAYSPSQKQYKLSLAGTGIGGEYAYHHFTADARF